MPIIVAHDADREWPISVGVGLHMPNRWHVREVAETEMSPMARSGFPGGGHATAISHVEQYHGKPQLRRRGPLGSHQGRVFGAQRVVSAAL